MYGISRFHGIFHLKCFYVWNLMEFSGIRTYGITWKYSIPFQGGAEGICWNFHSILFHQMERNEPLGKAQFIFLPHGCPLPPPRAKKLQFIKSMWFCQQRPIFLCHCTWKGGELTTFFI